MTPKRLCGRVLAAVTALAFSGQPPFPPGVAAAERGAASCPLETGRIALEKRSWDEAVSALTDAIRAKPDCGEAYLLRGQAYDAKGQAEKALADLSEAVRLMPKNSQAYYGRGRFYMHAGKFISPCMTRTKRCALLRRTVAHFACGGASIRRRATSVVRLPISTGQSKSDRTTYWRSRSRRRQYAGKGVGKSTCRLLRSATREPGGSKCLKGAGDCLSQPGGICKSVADLTAVLDRTPGTYGHCTTAASATDP